MDHRKPDLTFFEGWERTLKAFYNFIPAISDGGYTRGHFYEFLDGKVTIRDTVTSDVFHKFEAGRVSKQEHWESSGKG